MRIIFLDIDGVVSHANAGQWFLDAECVRRLNTLITATGAQIVISSTWRKFVPLQRLRQIFTSAGCVGEIIGATPVLYKPRGEEIQAWLTTHAPDAAFIILDDDSDMGDLLPRLVKTNTMVGLHDADVDRALQLFKVT